MRVTLYAMLYYQLCTKDVVLSNRRMEFLFCPPNSQNDAASSEGASRINDGVGNEAHLGASRLEFFSVVHSGERNFRHRTIKKLAERSPSFFHMELQESLFKNRRTNIFNMLVIDLRKNDSQDS